MAKFINTTILRQYICSPKSIPEQHLEGDFRRKISLA
jgi:hypothetical protein